LRLNEANQVMANHLAGSSRLLAQLDRVNANLVANPSNRHIGNASLLKGDLHVNP
jgi:hypothetical protein